MNNPLLIDGLTIGHNESLFIFDFKTRVTLTNNNGSPDSKEIHEIILVPKDMIKAINEMISKNIKIYEKTFKKLENKQDIKEVKNKDKKEANYFG